MTTSRRTFLKAASVGAMAIADAVSLPAVNRLRDSSVTVSDRSVQVWLTDDDQRTSVAPHLLTSESHTSFADSIVIEENKTFQGILGFGAAFTDGSCFLFNQLSPAAREE